MTRGNFLIPVLGAMLMTIGAVAQDRVEATIPFTFHAGEAVLPAGTYSVRMGEPANVITLVSKHNPKAAFIHAIRISRFEDGPIKMVFTRYGNVFYLRQVWGPDGGVRKVVKTEAEREAEMASKRTERIEVAMRASK
jgi:hypothetical protein